MAARHTFLLIALCWLGSLPALATTIVAPADVISDYQKLLAGREPGTLASFAGPQSRRDTVEVELAYQALRLGGYTAPIKLLAVDSYARAIAEVRAGHATLTGTSVWQDNFRDAPIDPSLTLIEDGQFEAALFTAPDNERALRSRTLADMRQLRAVSNSAWVADWRTLQQMKFARLDDVVQWSAMARMVASGGSDVVLAPFQNSTDGSVTVGKQRLVPIPGIKVVLHGTRHYAVSRHAADALTVKAALNKGLNLLRERRIVQRAYEDAGFFNPRRPKLIQLNP